MPDAQPTATCYLNTKTIKETPFCSQDWGKASLTPRLTNDDKQRLKWNSFKSPLKKIKMTTFNKSFSWSRRYGCRPTAVLYLIQSVVMDGNIIQSDGLFDIFKMSFRSCQCELIFVHVWNVLQDVVLSSLGNNLLGYNGSAMQHLLEGCKYYPHPQMMKGWEPKIGHVNWLISIRKFPRLFFFDHLLCDLAESANTRSDRVNLAVVLHI